MLVSLTGIIPPARHAPKRKYVDAEPTLLVGSYSLTSAHLRTRADVCNAESGRQDASHVVAYFSIHLSVPLNFQSAFAFAVSNADEIRSDLWPTLCARDFDAAKNATAVYPQMRAC